LGWNSGLLPSYHLVVYSKIAIFTFEIYLKGMSHNVGVCDVAGFEAACWPTKPKRCWVKNTKI
jgi:hypothetical protein